MNFGLLNPWSPLFIDFTIPIYFNKYKNIWNHFLKTIRFGKFDDIIFWKCWKVYVPNMLKSSEVIFECLETWKLKVELRHVAILKNGNFEIDNRKI